MAITSSIATERPRPVGRVIDAVDRERLAIAAAAGISTKPFVQIFAETGYTTEAAARSGSAHVALQESAPNRWIKGPPSLDHRYLHEDVGWGLVPWSAIGDVPGRRDTDDRRLDRGGVDDQRDRLPARGSHPGAPRLERPRPRRPRLLPVGRDRVNVAVVGAGNGGLAVAAHAGLAGHDVRVLDIRPESVARSTRPAASA